MRRWPLLFIQSGRCEQKSLFTGRVDFSFCLLQLGFDQSAKGDLVNYNARHDQSTKGD
jgi:hypothetical protein